MLRRAASTSGAAPWSPSVCNKSSKSCARPCASSAALRPIICRKANFPETSAYFRGNVRVHHDMSLARTAGRRWGRQRTCGPGVTVWSPKRPPQSRDIAANLRTSPAPWDCCGHSILSSRPVPSLLLRIGFFVPWIGQARRLVETVRPRGCRGHEPADHDQRGSLAAVEHLFEQGQASG